MKTLKLRQVEDRRQADVFIVRDVAQLGQRIQWLCMLSGKMACDSLFVLSNGQQGTALQFKAKVCSGKCVWLSPEFMKQHAELSDIVLFCMKQWQSKWKHMDCSEEIFLEAVRLANTKKRPTCMIAFLLVSEQSSEADTHDCKDV